MRCRRFFVLWLLCTGGSGVLEPPVALGAWEGGATIAVRSLRSGLPLRHPRPRLRRLLRIPSGASTRPALPSPQRNRLTAVAICRMPGRSVCLAFLPAAGGRERSCGARPRPAARAAFWGLHAVLRRGTAGYAPRARMASSRTTISAQRTPSRRTAMRKPQKAARAAGLGRATQTSPPPTVLAASHFCTLVAEGEGLRGGGQPRCARGNLKGRPKAWTKMTKGKSGAKAPDRNRGRPPPRSPSPSATYEDNALKP